MKIGVFCSANDNIDPDYFTLAAELGKWMGENGHSLVYGGTDLGMMKTIGHAVHDNGGQVIGVVPRIMESDGSWATCLDVEIPVDSLSDRKDIMTAHSDIFIAMPGGIGTLDEIFSVAASNSIGYHSKKVILYNMKGFWNNAIALLDDMKKCGMIRGEISQMIETANDLNGLKAFLTDYGKSEYT